MENKYYVSFGTGAGDECAETIERAKELAENGLGYTQKDVVIFDGETEVAILPWYGTKPTEDDYVTARFGNFGFYGDWREA